MTGKDYPSNDCHLFTQFDRFSASEVQHLGGCVLCSDGGKESTFSFKHPGGGAGRYGCAISDGCWGGSRYPPASRSSGGMLALPRRKACW